MRGSARRAFAALREAFGRKAALAVMVGLAALWLLAGCSQAQVVEGTHTAGTVAAAGAAAAGAVGLGLGWPAALGLAVAATAAAEAALPKGLEQAPPADPAAVQTGWGYLAFVTGEYLPWLIGCAALLWLLPPPGTVVRNILAYLRREVLGR